MASIKKVQLNPRGVREMLKSEQVQKRLDAEAESMAAAAGSGYEATTYPWRTRARSSVITATPRAMANNSKHQTLARVLAGKSVAPSRDYVTYTRKDGTTRQATRKQAENWSRRRAR